MRQECAINNGRGRLLSKEPVIGVCALKELLVGKFGGCKH